jgi:hypothetical protein
MPSDVEVTVNYVIGAPRFSRGFFSRVSYLALSDSLLNHDPPPQVRISSQVIQQHAL